MSPWARSILSFLLTAAERGCFSFRGRGRRGSTGAYGHRWRSRFLSPLSANSQRLTACRLMIVGLERVKRTGGARRAGAYRPHRAASAATAGPRRDRFLWEDWRTSTYTGIAERPEPLSNDRGAGGGISLDQLGMLSPLLLPAVYNLLGIHGVDFDLVPAVIGATTPLALRLAANALPESVRRSVKASLTIGTAMGRSQCNSSKIGNSSNF